MSRKPLHVQQVFVAPPKLEWPDDKLRALDQDQLLSLLANLDRQRASGRLAQMDAGPIESRIVALLTPRNARKRLKLVASDAAAENDE